MSPHESLRTERQLYEIKTIPRVSSGLYVAPGGNIVCRSLLFQLPKQHLRVQTETSNLFRRAWLSLKVNN